MFDWQNTFIEIRFPEVVVNDHAAPADNFLKVKETLTRIGAPAYTKAAQNGEPERTLWQSAHILQKRGRLYLVHFKQLFMLDGKESRTNLTADDLARLNAIALLLEQWGLIEIVDPSKVEVPHPAPVSALKVISYNDKGNWALKAKYDIGKTRKRQVPRE